MNNQPPKQMLGILCALLITCSPTFAQNANTGNEIQQYEELLQFRINHTIEQKEQEDVFAEILTGMDLKIPDPVYLTDLSKSQEPNKLPEVRLEEPYKNEPIPYPDTPHLEFSDLFPAEDSNSGSSRLGFGIGSTGHCPPGSSLNF